MADVGMFAAEPVLIFPDVEKAAEYYRDVLGFEITLIWRDSETSPATHSPNSELVSDRDHSPT